MSNAAHAKPPLSHLEPLTSKYDDYNYIVATTIAATKKKTKLRLRQKNELQQENILSITKSGGGINNREKE